jgi:type I restriction enzyme M protein
MDQDLVNYDLTAKDLADSVNLPDGKLCVAEAFVRFAQEQGLDFWEVG